MTRVEFLDRMEQLFNECLAISKAKNADYATGDDPFRNFRASEVYNIDPAQAILIRMSDKMARIGNLLDKEAAVKDESIYDTLSDLAVYSVILRMWLEERVSKI